jgi:hypothetical protein
MRLILALWLALLNPHFTALWDSDHGTTIQWTQAGRGCLSVEHATGERAFVGCYERTGTITIELGHVGPLDGTLRPAAGDVFILQTQGQTYRAPLRGRAVYLPVFRG